LDNPPILGVHEPGWDLLKTSLNLDGGLFQDFVRWHRFRTQGVTPSLNRILEVIPPSLRHDPVTPDDIPRKLPLTHPEAKRGRICAADCLVPWEIEATVK
jgi:hypothetical protein